MIRAIGRVQTADARRLVIGVPGWTTHQPGQFAMLSFDPRTGSQDPLLPRPMAVFRARGETLEFRFKVVGRGTRKLAGLAPGAELGVLGPLGRGFPPPDGPALLIGGGTGIASLYELAAASPSATRIRLGGRTEQDLLGRADFEALGRELVLCTEDGTCGRRGRVTDGLTLDAGEGIYACGPTPMLRAVHELARKAAARCLVSLENRMACGFGVCLGCAIHTRDGFRYVCTHGPVFDSEALDWESLP